MFVFMLNVLNYITIRSAVCKVCLRYKKGSYTKKNDFTFSFLSKSSNRTQNFKRLNKDVSQKNNRKVKY